MRRETCSTALLLTATLITLIAARTGAATPDRSGSALITPGIRKDVEGHSIDLTPSGSAKVAVFVFASTQCPISNLYMPRLCELERAYAQKGVRFYLIDPNSEDTDAALRAYAHQRNLPFPIIRDEGTHLADLLGVDKTPETAVLDLKGEIRYRGRIDDNTDRTRILHHDLQEALNELLVGHPVARPRTISFGCAIFRGAAAPSSTNLADVTYTRDIAPILNRRCVGCHRAGEVAPFALQTYQQALTWSTAIKDYSIRRIMPPWKAVTDCGEFLDSRGMTTQEIETLSRWVESGSPQGDRKDLPAPPTFPDASSWSLGKPDLVLQPARPYHLAAEGADVYRNFVLPIDFKTDRYISAMEFKPGNRAVVHHVVTYIDPTGRSASMDGKEKEPGYSVPGVTIGIPGAQWGEVWVPGRTPRFLTPGVAVRIPKGAKLVMQVHYHKNGAPQTDNTQMAIYFAKGKVEQIQQIFPLLNFGFDLKPGNDQQEVGQSITLPFDIHLRSIFPHMHLLGRKMRVTATLPDGTTKELISVDDWDFNWQETYLYREPVALPKGTKLSLTAIYDNSDHNPRQLRHPPVDVFWGEQTTDEMCLCVMGYTNDHEKLSIDVASAPR